MSQSVSILDCGGHQGWPHLQKQLHHCGVVILGCEVDGLLLQVIIPVNHSVKVNQSFAGGELTSSCGEMERGLLLDSQGLYGGPTLGNQKVNKLCVALGGCEVESSEAGLVLGIHKGIFLEEELADLHAAAVCSQVQGASAFVVEHINPGVTLEQHLHTLGVSSGGRPQKWRPAHVVLFVHRKLI